MGASVMGDRERTGVRAGGKSITRQPLLTPKCASHTTSSAKKEGEGTGTIGYPIPAGLMSTTFNTGTSLFGRHILRDDGHIESWRVSITKCEVAFIWGGPSRHAVRKDDDIKSRGRGTPVSAIPSHIERVF